MYGSQAVTSLRDATMPAASNLAQVTEMVHFKRIIRVSSLRAPVHPDRVYAKTLLKAGLKVVEEPISWGPCLCERKEGESGEYHATVSVESRTWPGINKPGGVGRITKRTLGKLPQHWKAPIPYPSPIT